MKRSYLLFLLALLLANHLAAQETSTLKPTFKLNPLGLIHPQPTIWVAYEHPLNKSISLQVDLGYILTDHLHPIIDNSKLKAQARIEPRFYFRPNLEDNITTCFYIAPQFFYKTVTYFSNEHTYTFTRENFGFHLKLGKQYFYKKHFIIDTFLGMGIKRIFTTANNKPKDPYRGFEAGRGLSLDYSDNTNANVPSIVFGAKIGFRL